MKAVTCIYFKRALAAPELSALAEACLRFSSQVAIRASDAVFVETGRSHLIHEPAALTLRLKLLAARYGDGPSVASGVHAAEALALARHQRTSVEELPLDALMDYASPFLRDPSVEAWMTPMLSALKSLGLSKLGSLLRLPAHSVGERFGPEAALLRERVAGEMAMGWPRFEPAVLMHEGERFEPVDDFERLSFLLKRLADRLAARLRGRGLRAGRLELTLGFERIPKLVLDLRLALPQAAPSALLALLRQAVETQRLAGKIRAPLVRLSVAAPELAPGRSSQASFFDAQRKEAEDWSSLVTRLSQKLGPDQVFLAELVQRYLPEKAWKKALREPEAAPLSGPAQRPAPAAAGAPDLLKAAPTAAPDALPLPVEGAAPASPPRPSRLLPKPSPLLREGLTLVLPGGQRWHAKAWQGPERLDGEWWQDGFQRDYFRVATDEGQDLWLYCEAGATDKAAKFWLHGVFD